MKNNTLILFSLLLAVTAAQAQQRKFQIGLGYQRTWMLDKQASPLKYQTSEKTFSLGYLQTGKKSKFNVHINGAIGDLFPTGFKNRQAYNPGYNGDGSPKKDSGLFVSNFYNARLNIGYARQVSNGYSVIGKEKMYSKNYVGASLNNQLFYTDNIIRNGWLNSSTINADFEHTATLNTKHFFNIKISIPLFAHNTRLPYHNTIGSANGSSNVETFFKQGSRFAWFNSFQNIQFDAGYEYALSKKVGLGVHYFGQWLHYNYEKPISLFQNNIGITASIK